MSEAVNPWLSHPVEVALEPVPHTVNPCTPTATGPIAPQRGVPAPAAISRLPAASRGERPLLWWMGAHGGAGESTLAALLPGSMEAEHVWPQTDSGIPMPVVVVARTSMRGLTAAQVALTQWASGMVPGVKLLGLVMLADAPGRLPRPLRDLARVVGGGAPRMWSVPWVPSWRMVEHPVGDDIPREVRRLIDDLHSLITSTETER